MKPPFPPAHRPCALAHRSACLLFLTFLTTSSTLLGAPKPPSYSIVELGTVTGSPTENSRVSPSIAFNQRGEVVGEYRDWTTGQGGAFLWSRGVMVPLPQTDPPSGMFNPVAIADNGLIAATAAGLRPSLPLILQDDQWTALPIPSDARSGWIAGINNRGVVCGSLSPLVPGDSIPVLWRDGFPERLPLPRTLPVQGGSCASINDHDQIAGSVSGSYLDPKTGTWVYISHAVVWTGGEVIDLHDPAFDRSYARDVSNGGVVLANKSVMQDGVYVTVPYLWHPRRGFAELPLLPGAQPNASAEAMNDNGDVVGNGSTGPVSYGPILWRNGQPYDLLACTTPAPNLRLGSALAVNARGQILCLASGSPWFTRPVILEPHP